MQVINTKTGEDVTRDYIALLEGKMTKQEFEKKYNLNIMENNYVIYNRALDNMLRFTTGEVIIYGDKQEAMDDLYGDEEVMLVQDLSLRNQQIISDQLEETPILGGRMKELYTEDLRNELAERGFQTANLWHIDDVLQNYECCDEDAMDVIRRALNNEYVMEVIFGVIDEVCNQEGINKKK